MVRETRVIRKGLVQKLGLKVVAWRLGVGNRPFGACIGWSCARSKGCQSCRKCRAMHMGACKWRKITILQACKPCKKELSLFLFF